MTNEQTNTASTVAEQGAPVAPEKAPSKKGATRKKSAPKGQKTAKGAKPKAAAPKKGVKASKKAAKSERKAQSIAMDCPGLITEIPDAPRRNTPAATMRMKITAKAAKK
jgi:hypothetical protein